MSEYDTTEVVDDELPDTLNIDIPTDDEEIVDDPDDDMDYERTPKEESQEPQKQNLGEPITADTGVDEDTSKTDVAGMKDEDEEEDTDEEEEDEEMFKKLEREIDTDRLIQHHPDIVQNNYQEILTQCKLIKNNKGVIIDELHKTYPFLSKYEYARVIGIRAKQLNNGADPFIEIERNIIDGFTIAKMELEAKKIPFIIARPLPNGSKEYWKLQDLELVHF